MSDAEFLDSLADRSLKEELPTREEARAVLEVGDEALRDLLFAALKVREATWGRRVKLCVLQNARSGLCPEDCHYCSQSAVSTAEIPKYRLLPAQELIEGARRAASSGARRYCMVTSGRGPSRRDIAHLCDATRKIVSEMPEMEICVSLGLLGDEEASSLRAAGVGWVNHNLNTSERFHPEICTTHTYADRVRTVLSAKKAGLSICSGGILGMGETDEDIIDLAFALREIGVDSLPVNLLHAIDGTPFGDEESIHPVKALRALCLFRFVNPRADIRAAGGRERNLGAWQSLALYPANSIFIQGYLTTPGQPPGEAEEMIRAMGFEVEGVEERAEAVSV